MSAPVSRHSYFGPTRAATLAVLAVFMLPTGTAHAQFPFWPQPRFWWGDHAPRHKHHRRHAKPEASNDAASREAAKGPLQIIISIADQRVSLYDNGALIARSPVSTGIPRHPTPLGVFSVIGKQRWHRSNLYSAAPMPYMQRITWSGIALHAGVVPGHPASHGCIRLTNGFANRLWHLTRRGTRVIIARDEVQPVEISNPHLFTPKAMPRPPEAREVTAGSAGVDAAAATVGALSSNAQTQDAASPAAAGPAPAAARRQKIVPISVFVSGKLSKLFVRRGFAPLFDVPVRIQNPEVPLGTHVFTAMEFPKEAMTARWTVVSMPDESSRLSRGAAKQREAEAKPVGGTTVVRPLADQASTALERIEMPPEAVDRISELLTPASSVIISDQGFGHETGNGTDFIVVTH
jgi:L,D-transpeptidase-like protein